MVRERAVLSPGMLRSFADGELFGEMWGEPPPRVIALHGWRRTHGDFTSVVGPGSGSDRYSALAVDLPGFGASPPPESAWGSAEYAALVARTLEEIQAPPVVVLGHSFGGRIGVHLAASRPDLVKALVLTGAPVARTGAPRRKPPLSFRTIRALRRGRLVPEVVLERSRQRHGSSDYLAARGVVRQVLVRLLAEDYDDRIVRIHCPVELVWADDDTEAPLAVGEKLATMIPGSNLTVCPGAGHMTPLTVPDHLRQAVDRALQAPCGAATQ
jgi:pimeloyl-ACP methyl ester carboxylesterase